MTQNESKNPALLHINQTSQKENNSKFADINEAPSPSESQDSSEDDEMEMEYDNRRRFRQHKLSTIKNRIDDKIQGRSRKPQNKIFYFLNLMFPIWVSVVNATVFLDIGKNSQRKGILIVIASGCGLICAIISCLLMASWKQVVKLYLIFDSVVPVVMAAGIGFFAVWDFMNKGTWYHLCYAIAFPIWIVYMVGTLRVMIAFCNWSRWEIILYKLLVLFAGLVNFYVGFQYMNGKYKISKGFYISLETQLRDLTYLYVFGNVELFFEMFRRLGDFDQTNQLKFAYKFTDQADDEKRAIAELEYKSIEGDVMQEEINDVIAFKMMSMRKITSKMSKKSEKSNKTNRSKGKKSLKGEVEDIQQEY